jgi:predicted DNA-binding protein YlxM (UPF0122 family)
MSDVISITLTKEEWSSVELWVNSASRETFEQVSKDWFTELLGIIKPFYMSLYFSDDFSAMEIPHDSEHKLEIERKYFKYLVFSVGRIAYDFDVKTQTSHMALEIVKKLEEQGDEKWKKDRF